MTDLTSFFKNDLVDDHMADDVNKLIASALRAEYANTETITATKELTDNDCQLQFITASGANRNVELPPEATTNHFHIIYNSGASNNAVVKDDSNTYTLATLAPDEYAICYPLNAESWRVFKYMAETEYKISPTVSSNVITLKITHLDGTDPTAFRPLACTINGTRRYMVAATSCTITTGSFFNLGATEFATLEQQLFVYLVWDSNSSVVAISASRKPDGRLVSDFSATTTNEKYLFNYANFTATDDVLNIGRFNVANSGTASFNWSVPAPTNQTVVNHPIYQTDWLVWVPTPTGFSANPTNTYYVYKIAGDTVFLAVRQGTNGTSNATTFTLTLPFSAATTTNAGWQNAAGVSVDNSVQLTTPGLASILASAPTIVTLFSNVAGAAWTASGGKRIVFSTWYKAG